MSIIEDFVTESTLDERAADALRSCRPEVQMAVLERGSLKDARNPSSAVLGRIRDAEKDAVRSARRAGVVASETEVEVFLLENVVDERAAEAMRAASAEAQHAVIQRGSLQDAKNPSSALLGRLRDAEGHSGGKGGKRGRASDDGQLEALVESFISVGGLDERAAEALRKAPPMAQQSVIDRGTVSECRNPSSAVLGRLKDAKNDSAVSSKGMGKGYDAYGGWGGDGGYGGFGPSMGGFGGGLAELFGGGPYEGPGSWKMGGKGGGMYGKSQGPKRGVPRPGSVETDVEAFIETNGLDERATEAFRSSPPEVQQAVMEMGDLKNARNPSSAVLGRMKDAKNEIGNAGGSGGSATPQEVEDFITSNALDERAADAVRGCNPGVQRIVIDRGSLEDARNPSSAVLGRIKDASSSAGGWAPSPVGFVSAQSFIKENGIDERAAEALVACKPSVQQAVLSRGSLKDARNPSSALLGRIKDAQNDEAGKGGGGMKGMKGGKGGYGGCGGGGDGGGVFDMVMSMLTGGGGGGWGGDSWGGGGMKGGKKGSRNDVQAFLRDNNVDERAANDFMNADRSVQQAVMERGDLANARNPSSALLGRLKDAMGGKGGGKGKGPKGLAAWSPY